MLPGVCIMNVWALLQTREMFNDSLSGHMKHQSFS